MNGFRINLHTIFYETLICKTSIA